jgi:hypothetical protein
MAPSYSKTPLSPKSSFLQNRVPKFLLVVDIFISLFYFFVITFWFQDFKYLSF